MPVERKPSNSTAARCMRHPHPLVKFRSRPLTLPAGVFADRSRAMVNVMGAAGTSHAVAGKGTGEVRGRWAMPRQRERTLTYRLNKAPYKEPMLSLPLLAFFFIRCRRTLPSKPLPPRVPPTEHKEAMHPGRHKPRYPYRGSARH